MNTPNQPAPHVFVSYSRNDRPFAQRLVSDLEKAGAQVWWDVTGIDEGSFPARISEALARCEWFVLVLTPFAIESPWVNQEMNAALNRRTQGFMRGVIPMLAAPCPPGSIPPLWDMLHRFDATRDYEEARDGVLHSLGVRTPVIPPPAVVEHPSPPVSPLGPATESPHVSNVSSQVRQLISNAPSIKVAPATKRRSRPRLLLTIYGVASLLVIVSAIAALSQGLLHSSSNGPAAQAGASARETAAARFVATVASQKATATAFFGAGYAAPAPGPCDSAHQEYWSHLDSGGTYTCDGGWLTMSSRSPGLVSAVYFHGPASDSMPRTYQVSVNASPAGSHSCADLGLVGEDTPNEAAFGLTIDFDVCGDGNWYLNSPLIGNHPSGAVISQSSYSLSLTVQQDVAQQDIVVYSINGNVKATSSFAGTYAEVSLSVGNDSPSYPPPAVSARFQAFALRPLP